MGKKSQKNPQAFVVERQPLEKMSTGISGLDEVLSGGVPVGRATLIRGGAGAGKTVVAMEFACHAAQRGEAVVFVTFEETAEALRRNALSFGWDLGAMEEEGKLALVRPSTISRSIRAGSFSLGGELGIESAPGEGARFTIRLPSTV